MTISLMPRVIQLTTSITGSKFEWRICINTTRPRAGQFWWGCMQPVQLRPVVVPHIVDDGGRVRRGSGGGL